MSDKSPRQHMATKAPKSIKEKRADKKAKTEGDVSPTIVQQSAKNKKRS